VNITRRLCDATRVIQRCESRCWGLAGIDSAVKDSIVANNIDHNSARFFRDVFDSIEYIKNTVRQQSEINSDHFLRSKFRLRQRLAFISAGSIAITSTARFNYHFGFLRQESASYYPYEFKEQLFPFRYVTNIRSWLSAYRDACESVINKTVARHTVKSVQSRVRIDQITIARHVWRCGTEGDFSS